MDEIHQLEAKLTSKVNDLVQVEIPAYMLVNYAVRHNNVIDKLEDDDTPLTYVLNKYTNVELQQLAQAVESEYEDNNAVIHYITEYVKECNPDADSLQLKHDFETFSKALPAYIQRMNACDNYKLCFYIAQQRSAKDNSQHDVSEALKGDPQLTEKIYTELCDSVNRGTPMDVATHQAGRKVNKLFNLTPEAVSYDYNRSALDNMRTICGDDSILRYSDRHMVAAKRDTKVPPQYTAYEPRRCTEKSYVGHYEDRAPHRCPNMRLHAISVILPTIFIVLGIIGVLNAGFAFRSVTYTLSVVICVLAFIQTFSKEQHAVSIVLSIVGAILYFLSPAI